MPFSLSPKMKQYGQSAFCTGAILMVATLTKAHQSDLVEDKAIAKHRASFESDYNVLLQPLNEPVYDARLRFIRSYQPKMEPFDWKEWNKQADNLTEAELKAALALEVDSIFAGKSTLSEDDYADQILAAFEKEADRVVAMNVKQTPVRFGVIDYDQDGFINLGEFQEIGLKSFDTYDANHDGIINSGDEALYKADKEATSKEYREGIKSVVNLGSEHSLTGFVQRYMKKGKPLTQGTYLLEREKHFQRADANEDGVIDVDEYVSEFNVRLEAAREHSQEDFEDYSQDLASVVDSNNDGDIRASEHAAYVTRLFKGFDTNQDGALNKDDAIAK
ncbi:MAG: hypothetical protein SVC26_04050 [Pseudomonadota bacterium]|nr:hypothetical protein [Pseudomonadota bacterium]